LDIWWLPKSACWPITFNECGKTHYLNLEKISEKLFFPCGEFHWSLNICQLPKVARWPITFNKCGKPKFKLKIFKKKFFFGRGTSLEFEYLAAAKGSALAHYLQQVRQTQI